MHKLRVLLALIFGILIVFWLTTWFRTHQDSVVTNDPLQPIRTRIGKITQRFGLKTGDGVDTPQVAVGSGVGEEENSEVLFAGKLHPDFQLGSVKLNDVDEIMDETVTFWNKDSEIVLLQRCDFVSKTCQESYEAGSVYAYLNAFPEQLSYQLHGYPINNKTETMLNHAAAACAQKNADAETYLSFYFSLYQAKGKLSKADIVKLSESLNIDGMKSCLEDVSFTKLQKTMKSWRSLFGFSSLPANVLINKKTGQYMLIPGLYDQKDVLQAIQWMVEQE